MDTTISWARSFSCSGALSTLVHTKGVTPYWSCLEERYVKLNTDGSVFSSKGYVSIGGVIRDDRGHWVCGLVMSLGERFIFQVEARAMLEGLQLAWDRGFRKVEVESDNSPLVETILTGGATDSSMMELRLVYDMIIKDWDVRIRHIPHDQNKVTDYLTKVVNLVLTRLILLDDPPLVVKKFLLVDFNLSRLQ